MKFMKWTDLEPGDIIKFDIGFIKKNYWSASFITNAEKYNAKIIEIDPIHIYVRFILKNGQDVGNTNHFSGRTFDRTPFFEIIELADDK